MQLNPHPAYLATVEVAQFAYVPYLAATFRFCVPAADIPYSAPHQKPCPRGVVISQRCPPLMVYFSTAHLPVVPLGDVRVINPPYGSVAGVAVTLIASACDAVLCGEAESVTIAVKLEEPVLDGVPEITPVAEARVKPGGN